MRIAGASAARTNRSSRNSCWSQPSVWLVKGRPRPARWAVRVTRPSGRQGIERDQQAEVDPAQIGMVDKADASPLGCVVSIAVTSRSEGSKLSYDGGGLDAGGTRPI